MSDSSPAAASGTESGTGPVTASADSGTGPATAAEDQAETPTRKITNVVGGFSIMLPGTWAAVPMTTPTAVKAAVASIVKRQMPAGDRLARLRRNARDELQKTALEALENEGTMFAMALELLPGLAFGASLVSFEPGWPPDAPAGDDGDEGRLRRAFPGCTIVPSAPGAMARTGERITEKPGEDEMPAFDLQYWLVRPDGEPVVFMISIPMCPDDQLFTIFFDEVLDSVRWAVRREAAPAVAAAPAAAAGSSAP